MDRGGARDDVLRAALERARRNRAAYGIVTEMERILSLPEQRFDGTATVDKWWHRFRRNSKALPPRPIQAEILDTCEWAASQDDPIGMMGNVAVGAGKTLPFFLMPEVFNARVSLLLVPPSLIAKTEEDLFFWHAQYKFRIPYILSYSKLSQPASSSFLRELNPDLIMADEAHCLRHPSAARTKRFLRYMHANPECRFVAMSGTLTGTTLTDYAHLSRLSLRQYSPLPEDDRTLNEWGSVLNAEGEPDEQAWLTLAPLNQAAAKLGVDASSLEEEQRAKGVMRKAYQVRLKSCPGVVTTEASSCDARLVIYPVQFPMNDNVMHALDGLRDEWVLPNGDEVVDALHFHRALGQLSCGFYYVWDWPDGIEDTEWLDARRAWWSACRWYLTRFSAEGRDSPFLVEEYVRKNKRPAGLLAALEAWDEQRHKDPPPTRAIWLDYQPIIQAVQWLEEREQGIVWYGSRAVGNVLDQFAVPRFGAGDTAPSFDEYPKVALSIQVFHKGHNLQPWNKQLVMEPSPSGATWEQMMGRTHRQGQQADCIDTWVYQHTWPLRNSLKRARGRARYIQDLTGQPQKLLLAEVRGRVVYE